MIPGDNNDAVHRKIKTIKELSELSSTLRKEGKKIVHCHGVFDLLHIGHIRYFNQARMMGDVLVVTVTPDRYVDKGPHRPAFTETLRAEAIASLSVIDYVAINEWPTAEETLRLLKPDVYVKGSEFKITSSDMTGKIAREEQVVEEIGATLAFTDDIVFSSSNLINRYLSGFEDEVQQYIDLFRQRYTLSDMLELIDSMASLNVLVIGDTILDEYQYCDVIGKSSKDPILALKYKSHDLFAGGVLAVANHVADFVDSVKLVSILGDQDTQEDFIWSKLHPNITPHFEVQHNSPTITKRRFIDRYSFSKLFEVYIMNDSGLSVERDEQLCEWMRAELSKYDLVIAADFGHGAVSKNMKRTLIDHSPFLAVNTQANAGNRGFNTVTRYSRADYVCIAEHEIRLEARDLTGKLRPIMDCIAEKLQCRNLVVTRGRNGCYVRDAEGGFTGVPSFAQKIVDRVGAGDAFFSVTSLAAARDLPMEIIGFLGNIAGSMAAETMGNKKPIDKMRVKKYITSLLK